MVRSPSSRVPLAAAVTLVVVSGTLCRLAFPPTRWWWLGWLALAPLFRALAHQGGWRGAALGLLWGLLFEAHFLWWAKSYGYHALMALVTLRALGATALGAFLGSCREPTPLLVAGLWTFIEYVGTWNPFGITWDMQANILCRSEAWLVWASWAGSWVLTWWLVLVNASLALARPRSLLVVMLAAWLAFGVGNLVRSKPLVGGLRVAAVQVNLGQEVKWDASYREFGLDRLESLTRLAVGRGAQVVVWPETSVPYRNFLSRARLTMRVGGLARELSSYLVTGSVEEQGQGRLNTLALFGPEGDYRERYEKIRLAPCAEYLPGPTWLRELEVFDRVQNYVPGQHQPLLEVDDWKLGCLVCYESMTPTLASQRVREGADALLVVTNDAHFVGSPGLLSHFDSAVLRAAETGRAVLQCANTGVSGWVTATGRVMAESQAETIGVVVADLARSDGLTPYVKLGDWCPWFGLGLGWLSLLRTRRTLAQRVSGPESKETRRPIRPGLEVPGEESRSNS